MDRPTTNRADSAQSRDSQIQKYYQESIVSEVGQDGVFQDLDDSEVLETSMQAVSSSSSRNFVLDFSDSDARVGFDLPTRVILDLLQSKDRPDELNTRWINIWYPFQQKDLLTSLAKHYDFSPRLLAMMCSDPHHATSGRSSVTPRSSTVRHVRSGLSQRHGRPAGDAERGNGIPDAASVASNNPARTGNIYDIADEVWHYTSVDQGRNYLCLGYNSIYNTGAVELPKPIHSTTKPPLPHCKRVWTWLLLCSDRTIVTINEDLYPYNDGRLTRQEQEVLMDTRRNMINVFRSLSYVDEGSHQNPLTLLPIRKRLGNTPEENAHRMTDAPGMLFYYLFENWFNSYSIVTRRDSRYGTELDHIREQMFEKPGLGLIDRLDQIGNQLGVLKRHYKSYIRIIDRVIEPPVATVASLENFQIVSDPNNDFRTANQPGQPMLETNSLLGMSLSSAARVRFERLKDLIYLYALSEVKDYIAQKDSLVQMNFQLIAIKESRDVERLTRVSLLITKATILFLPVTFMTSYFSTDLNQNYTVTTYWATFAVVFFASWIALFGFGVLSGTMESWRFFPPVRRYVQEHILHRHKRRMYIAP